MINITQEQDKKVNSKAAKTESIWPLLYLLMFVQFLLGKKILDT